ncbi:MAG: hypothetical protein ABIU77_03545 [Ferruginibacter sp.]
MNNYFALLILLLAFNAEGQSTKSKIFAEASLGLSIPARQFSNKTFLNYPNENLNGNANIGPAINLLVGYCFEKNLGVLFQIAGSLNKQNTGSLTRYYENLFAQSNSGDVLTSVTTNRWKMVKLMTGLFWGTPGNGSKKISVNIRLLAGAVKTAIPEYGFTASNPNGSFSSGVIYKINLPFSFCYNAGVGLKYLMFPKLYLTGDLSYFQSTNKYKTVYRGPVKYSLSSVLPMVGVGYNF